MLREHIQSGDFYPWKSLIILLSSSSVTEATLSIPASDERTFHLTNIYVQDSGKLVLKKNFANGSALNSTNMTAAQRKRSHSLSQAPMVDR